MLVDIIALNINSSYTTASYSQKPVEKLQEETGYQTHSVTSITESITRSPLIAAETDKIQ